MLFNAAKVITTTPKIIIILNSGITRVGDKIVRELMKVITCGSVP
jgi:hypothetical protein